MKTLTETERVERARMMLIMDHPFWGTLAMRLKLVESTRAKTLATDGTHVFFNPKYTATLSDFQLQGAIAHEVGHNMFGHAYRMEGRDHTEWNICGDYAINPILIRVGELELPPGVLIDDQYGMDMNAEQIYAARYRDRLEEQAKQNQAGGESVDEGDDDDQDDAQSSDDGESNQDANDESDDQDQDGEGAGDNDDSRGTGATGSDPRTGDAASDDAGGSGDASDSSGSGNVESFGNSETTGDSTEGEWDHVIPASASSEGDDEAGETPMSETDWQIAAFQAAAYSAGGSVGGDTLRAIEKARETSVDWRTVLREFIEQVVPTDYSWTTPNRRFVGSNVYLPGAYKNNTPRLLAVVDTSGSIPPAMLEQGASELTTIMHDVRPSAIDVIYVDTSVRNVQAFTPDDEEITFEPRGGGGTYFQPAFDWIAEADEPPAAVIFFTDTYCADKPMDPGIPVLWVVPEWIGREMEFGQMVRWPVNSF